MLFEQLNADWRAMRGRESRRALVALLDQEPQLAVHADWDLHDLVDVVPRLESLDGPRAIQAMLRSAGAHDLVPRAILQCLSLGLTRLARRFDWGKGVWSSPETFLTDCIATTWEVINDWKGMDRPYALGDIFNAVRCRLSRQRSSMRQVPIPLEHGALEVELDPAAPESGPDLLLSAMELCPMPRAEREALFGVRVLGLSVFEVATQLHHGSKWVRRHLEAAEQRVAEAV